YLKFKGYRVTQVMNITDVDDRIISKSQENGKSIDDYTAKYIEAFWEDFDALGCQRPEVAPRATKHIPEMVGLIERLEQREHAYRSDSSIYYRISSFPEYGKLSKINFAGNIAGGSERVDTDKYEKEDARDFALWKAPTKQEEPAWETTIGRGRPGWHIECSAMSMKYLGETFDLHAATEQALAEFEAGMDDDLNTSVALAAVHELTREVNTALARRTLREDNKREVMAAIERIDSVLNVFGQPQREMLDEEIQELI